MKSRWSWLLALLLGLFLESASAQFMRPPAFAGGIPGRAQFQSILMQRHQARTLLYREALEELRKNPQAADLPVCGGGVSGPCLTPAVLAPVAPSAEEAAVPPAPTIAAKKPSEPEPKPEAKPAPSIKPAGRRIALLVGNNDYAQPIPPLETPIADVSEIAKTLEARFDFKTQVIKNASQARIIEAINKIAADVHPEDKVLLFYAGHGYLMDDIKMGFWIPVGASVKTAKGWISNSDISKLLAAIPAQQLILISDSCFSGSLTKEQKVSDMQSVKPEEVLQRRSVVVFSSGGDEPVSDEGKEGHSIFAWNLIKTLQETGAVTPGVRVWRTVHGEVSKDYPQEPQYGAVVSAGHMAGGDYLFMPK